MNIEKFLFVMLLSVSSWASAAANVACGDLVKSRVEALAKEFVRTQIQNLQNTPYTSKELRNLLEQDPSLKAHFEQEVRRLFSLENKKQRSEKKPSRSTEIWLEEPNVETFLKTHKTDFQNFRISSDARNEMLVVESDWLGNKTKLVKINISTGVKTVVRISSYINLVSISSNLNYIAGFDKNDSRVVFDAKKKKRLLLTQTQSQTQYVPKISENSQLVLYRENSLATVYDLKTGAMVYEFNLFRGQIVRDFLPDNTGLLVTEKNDVFLLDMKTKKTKNLYSATMLHDVQASQDGKFLYVLTDTQLLKVDIQTKQAVWAFDTNGLSRWFRLGANDNRVIFNYLDQIKQAFNIGILEANSGTLLADLVEDGSIGRTQSGSNDEYFYEHVSSKDAILRFKTREKIELTR